MFRIATNPDDLIKVFIVRGIVFLEEQNVPYAIEMDDYENSATHILGEIDGEPFAANCSKRLISITFRCNGKSKAAGYKFTSNQSVARGASNASRTLVQASDGRYGFWMNAFNPRDSRSDFLSGSM